MASARFDKENEVSIDKSGGWQLCFQYGIYCYDDDREPERGYRFIWKRPDDTLQPARGQARIPSIADMFELLAKAVREGWDLY